jgi:hypothetical protein
MIFETSEECNNAAEKNEENMDRLETELDLMKAE